MSLDNKEWLEEQFRNHTRQEIADMIGVSLHTVRKHLKIHDIKKEKKYDKIFLNKDWLENEYRTKTINKIAKEIGCSLKYVCHALKNHGISANNHKILCKDVRNKLNDKEWLLNEFDTKSINKISRELGISPCAVNNALRRYDVVDLYKHKTVSKDARRLMDDYIWMKNVYKHHSLEEMGKFIGVSVVTMARAANDIGLDVSTVSENSKKILDDKDLLEKLYISNNENILEVAEIIGVSGTTVANYMDKYGIYHGPISKKCMNLLNDKEYMDSEYSKMSIKEMGKNIGVTKKTISIFLKNHGISVDRHRNQSSIERSIITSFPDENIECNIRTLIPHRNTELDIYFKDHNFGVEVDGYYWHSKKKKTYHQDKIVSFIENKTNIIQIWDYEWENPVKQEIIIAMINRNIGNSVNINLSNICNVDKSDIEKFLLENHIQGYYSCDITYGGYSDTNELVCICSFTGDQITRICMKNGYDVINGYENIIDKYFEDNFNIRKLTYYCDIRYGIPFDDVKYEIAGPNPIWVHKNSHELAYSHPIDDSMYVKVYDSGAMVFVFTK